MALLMLISIKRCPESVRVSRAFNVATCECRVRIDPFEHFQKTWIDSRGQIITGALNQTVNDPLIPLADLAEESGIILQLVVLQTCKNNYYE
jgi:hypothetical protein